MVPQVSSGVAGLDHILAGGYLAASPTLLIGQPGCGKTLFLLSFLAAGAADGQRSVCATCTEAPERLIAYMDALGHPVDSWIDDGLLRFVDLRPVPGETVIGDFDLDAVMARMTSALEAGGHKATEGRLAIDDLNRLSYAFDDERHASHTTNVLFRSLRESGITTLISASDSAQTRATLADYTADAVISLSQSVANRLMTRILRVDKLRGVGHGTNEYPFLIDATGPRLMPVTSVARSSNARREMVSTGLPDLDTLLGGGMYRASSVMVSGSSGTGKSTLLGQMALGLASTGLHGSLYTFEQDPVELLHDWAGVGIRLDKLVESGAVDIRRARATERGLEEHLIRIARHVQDARLDFLIIDPVSAFTDVGDPISVKTMLVRLVDICKGFGTLVIFSELMSEATNIGLSTMALSSLLDAWLRLELHRQGDEYIRLLRILKSRGAKTSGQIKEFRITPDGLVIEDPYLGDGTFVFGTEKLIRRHADARRIRSLSDSLARLKRRMDILTRDYESRLSQTAFERDEALAATKAEIEDLETKIAALADDSLEIDAQRGG